MDTPPGREPPSRRPGPNPPPASDEQLLEWVVANPKATSADLTRHWGFTRSAGHRAYQRVHKVLLAQKATEHRARTPAARLPEQDRETVLGTVRDSQAALRLLAKRLREQVEKDATDGTPPSLDRDTTQAMLSLQRATAGLIETHPGLLELAREAEDDKATDDDLDGILAALGIPADDGPAPDGGPAPRGAVGG